MPRGEIGSLPLRLLDSLISPSPAPSSRRESRSSDALMREQTSSLANYIQRPDPHSPRHSVRPQPSYTSVFQNLGNGPSRHDILQGPLVEGFPHHNATPKDIETGSRRARNTLTKNTAGVERRDSSRQHNPNQQQQGPVAGLQRQPTGGLFVEAPSPSTPPHQGRDSHSEGLDSLVQSLPPATDPADLPPLGAGVPSRGIFSKTRGHYVVAEKEVKADRKRADRGTTRRVSSAGNQSDDRNQILSAVTMSDKGDRVYEHAEKSGGLTKRQKLRRHCAKWWWAHLIVLLAITALVICLM